MISEFQQVRNCKKCGWFQDPRKEFPFVFMKDCIVCPKCGDECASYNIGQVEYKEVKRWFSRKLVAVSFIKKVTNDT